MEKLIDELPPEPDSKRERVDAIIDKLVQDVVAIVQDSRSSNAELKVIEGNSSNLIMEVFK